MAKAKAKALPKGKAKAKGKVKATAKALPKAAAKARAKAKADPLRVLASWPSATRAGIPRNRIRTVQTHVWLRTRLWNLRKVAVNSSKVTKTWEFITPQYWQQQR